MRLDKKSKEMIQNELSNRGYKLFAKEFSKTTNEWVYTSNATMYNLSSIVSGRCDNRWIKDGLEIIYGLNECGMPPCLISPRPFKNGISDLEVIGLTTKYGASAIIDAIENKEILY